MEPATHFTLSAAFMEPALQQMQHGSAAALTAAPVQRGGSAPLAYTAGQSGIMAANWPSGNPAAAGAAAGPGVSGMMVPTPGGLMPTPGMFVPGSVPAAHHPLMQQQRMTAAAATGAGVNN